MNYRSQLERLHDQFLRVTNEDLGRAAMIQGASIIISAMNDGALPKSIGVEEIAAEIRTTEKGYEYVVKIQEYCFVWYAREVTKNEAFRRMNETNDASFFGEMYAAFCVELIGMLPTQNDTNSFESKTNTTPQLPNEGSGNVGKHSTLDSIAATIKHRKLPAVDQCEVELKAFLESGVVDSTWKLDELAAKMGRTKRTVGATPTWRSWQSKK